MEDIFRLYQQKEIEELQKIKPHWAYDKHSENSQCFFRDQLNEGYRVLLLTPFELVKHADFSEVNPEILFTGNSTNDQRIARILYRWENKKFVVPPTIHLTPENTKTLSFSDGRHRAKLSYLLKHKFILAAIHSDDINIIGKIMELTSYDNNRFK